MSVALGFEVSSSYAATTPLSLCASMLLWLSMPCWNFRGLRF